METEIINRREIAQWVSRLDESFVGVGLERFWLGLIFCGDRLACCDEAVVLKIDGEIVAAATISPEGENADGQPTIVGVYVLPQFRGKGLGRQVLEAAIHRCAERNLIPFRIDIDSTGMHCLVTKLPAEFRDQMIVNDAGIYVDG